MAEGPRFGLHVNVAKTEVFWPSEDPRSRLPGVFPTSIARPVSGVTVLGGPVSTCPIFGSELVGKRVAKTIELMDLVARLDDPQCELLMCSFYNPQAYGSCSMRGRIHGEEFNSTSLESQWN